MWGLWDHQAVIQGCAGSYPGPYQYLTCVAVVENVQWPMSLYEIFVTALVTATTLKVVLFYRNARRWRQRCEEMDALVD